MATDSKTVGFDTPNAFLSYCVVHSETQRHLFNGKQVNYLHELADEQKLAVADDSWFAANQDYIKPLVNKARTLHD